jgi:hypothetical protein
MEGPNERLSIPLHDRNSVSLYASSLGKEGNPLSLSHPTQITHQLGNMMAERCGNGVKRGEPGSVVGWRERMRRGGEKR